MWFKFHADLHANLGEDPSFGGEWVHELCAIAYPVIWRVISVDPSTDDFSINTDCPAGVLAMVVVCAQSAMLQHVEAVGSLATASGASSSSDAELSPGGLAQRMELEPAAGGSSDNGEFGWALGPWRRTQRVVLEEGAQVADFYGSTPLEECVAQCERRATEE